MMMSENVVSGKFKTEEGVEIVISVTECDYSAIINGYKTDKYDKIPKIIAIETDTISDLCKRIESLKIDEIYTDQIENFIMEALKINDKLNEI